MIHGVLDNSFDLQEGDQVFFLAPGEQIEIVPVNNDEDDDDSDDSDYEETDTEDESDDEEEDDGEDNEEEERHQFYRQQAAEWHEHQELEEAKAEQLFEDEWRYREQFEDELRNGQLTQEEVVVSDTESDTEELPQEEVNIGPRLVLGRERWSDYLTPVLGRERWSEIMISNRRPEDLPQEEERIHLGPPPVLRRERASDYLTPNTRPEVSTPEAPRANRRVLRDITNIVPRRLRFNN